MNLGRVKLNDTVGGSFTIVNDSPRPVQLGPIIKSCACTTAELSQDKLAPGEEAVVTFAVRTGERRGGRAESVAVPFTVALDEQAEVVFAKVLFIPTGTINVSQPELLLTRDTPQAEFTVQSESPTVLDQIVSVQSQHPCIEVDTTQLPKVVLKLNPEVLSESIINTACVIQTTVPGEETLTVPVRVRK